MTSLLDPLSILAGTKLLVSILAYLESLPLLPD